MYVILYMSCFLNSQQLALQTILYPAIKMTYNVETRMFSWSNPQTCTPASMGTGLLRVSIFPPAPVPVEPVPSTLHSPPLPSGFLVHSTQSYVILGILVQSWYIPSLLPFVTFCDTSQSPMHTSHITHSHTCDTFQIRKLYII
jgi:hypothetical protein